MAVELGQGYISVSAETRNIPRQIRGALNSGAAGGTAAGSLAGNNFASGLKKMIVAAGIAKVVTSAVGAGFDRINTLEKADIQFRNMGYSASQTKRQLDDLNNIVTGTSTSLSDAAGAAAMLGGAGVKAGDDMNNAVKALVNISSASGASARDIGIVMMQIKASGKLMGSEALQLAQRGVPIYDLVSKSIGKTTAEVRKMGEAGEISFEQVVKAVNDGTGNLAKEMGQTLPAQVANLKTALARASAEGMKPFWNDSKSVVKGLAELVNRATPAIGRLSQALHDKIFEEWGPKVREAFSESGGIKDFANGFKVLSDAASDAGPALSSIFTSIGQATVVSSFQLFVATLHVAATALQALTPLLTSVAGFMEDQPGLVSAAVLAWMAFKTVPGVISRLTGALAPAAQATRTFGSTMQTAYQVGAAGAQRFTRTSGAAAVALTGMQRAGSGLVSALGGPLNAAIVGVTVVGGALASSFRRQSAIMAEQDAATKALSESHLELASAMQKSRGTVTEDVMSIANQRIDEYKTKVDAAARADGKWHEVLFDVGAEMVTFGTLQEGLATRNDASAAKAQAAQDAFSKLGLTTEDVGKRVYGSVEEWRTLEGQLIRMGPAGQEVASDLRALRTEFNAARILAKSLTPGVSEMSEAMKVLGDSASTAADKTKALSAAIEAMNPARSKGDALAKHAETIDQITKSTQSAIDQTKGFGSALLDSNTAISVQTENGRALRQTLIDMVDASKDAASNGVYTADVQRQNANQLANLAKQYGLSVKEINIAADSLGMDDLDLVMRLSVEDDGTQKLGAISMAWQAIPTDKTISVKSDLITDQTRAKLTEMGITVSQPMNGKVTLTADTDKARIKLLDFTKQFEGLNNKVSSTGIILRDGQFIAKTDTAKAKLRDLAATVADPQVKATIDNLLQGHGISMQKLAELDGREANALISLLTDKALSNAREVNEAIDNAARTRTAIINVVQQSGANYMGPGSPIGGQLPGGANGFVRQYAKGGIEYGGRLAKADIIPGRGLGKLFLAGGTPAIAGEGETGGEAFIPLGDSKRKRSTALLASVANLFGWSLVPKDSLSGMFGAMAASATKKLIGATGVDGIARFANGGVTADSLRKLADGQGASQPLTGAPYRWGQVNWGDCSGAMSAFARFAVGLDPWGGRFATASEGSQLAAMGFSSGRGTSGDLRFGWYNGGAGGGHTAGTLPDGTNVEMGGGNGGGMVGGRAAGADDPQFTDHAYLTIGKDFTSHGTDDGGYVTGGGNYLGGDTVTPGSAGSGDTSISGRAGSVVGAFVTGQLADIFKTLYINDTPGVLGALAEYENSRKQTNPTDTTASKRDYEDAKLKAKQAYEAEKLKRKQDYEAERAKLKAEVDAKKISRTQYETRLAELKKKFDETELAKKQEYDKKTLEAKQKYDDLQRSQRTLGGSPTISTPKDPGTSVPKKGQDLGPGKSSGSETPKDAVKRAFQPNNWNTGKFWDDTDWIVGKESGWNPKAQNPSSTAYGLFQFLDETWGAYGSVKTDDPFKQGEAGLKYIQKRYGDPSKARSFWEANGWYDKGGVASGAGFMAKGTIKPERILNDRQTAAFDKMVERNFETREPALVGGGDTYNYSFEITGSNATEIANKVERKMRFNSAKSRGRPV